MLIDKVFSCSVPTTKGPTSIQLSASWFLIHYRMLVYKFTFNSSAIVAAAFVFAIIGVIIVVIILALTINICKKNKNKSG